MSNDYIERAVNWLVTRLEPLRGDGRGWVLTTVAVGWFLTLGIRFVIPALLPGIKESFGVENTALGFAMTLLWLSYAAVQLPAGVFTDRIGERILLTLSLLLAGTSITLFWMSSTFGLFLLAAVTLGVATGVYGPSRGTVLTSTFSRGAGAAFGITLAAGSIGSAAMPFIATQVSLQTNWRLALSMFAPLFVLVALSVWWAVPEKDTTDAVAVSWMETLQTVKMGLTQFRTMFAVIGTTLLRFTFEGLTAFYPMYLIEMKGLDQGTAGSLFALLFTVGAGYQLIAGRAVDRFGHRTVLVAVALLNVPPLLALPFVDGVIPLAVITVLLGVRLGMGPASSPYIILSLPSSVQGTTWGLIRTILFGIGATGSVTVGVVADAGMFDGAFLGLAVLTLLAAAAFALLPVRPDPAV